MGNSYNSKQPCSAYLVKGIGETPSTDCITDILDGEGINVSGTKQIKVISLLPPQEGHIGGVTKKDDPENAIEINPETGEIFAEKIDFPITIPHGGTGQTNKNNALNALLPPQTNNNNKVLGTNGTDTSWVTVSSDLTNYYTKAETNTEITEALIPINLAISQMQAIIVSQGQAISQLQQNLTDEITRATYAEFQINNKIDAQQIQIDAMFSGANVLKSGIPILANVQAALATGGKGISFEFSVSGVTTGVTIFAADCPNFYTLAQNIQIYMKTQYPHPLPYPDFKMIYDGERFIISNNATDQILISPNSTMNDLLKISANGGAVILNNKTNAILRIL